MNHFSSAFYYLKGELILNGQIEKYWTSLSRSAHKISPLSFPEVQMILKIAFVELWTYLLTSPNNFPSFKVTKTSSSSSQRIFGKKM